MTTPLPPYPDAELVLLDLLEPVGGPDTTVTHTDEDLTAPCLQVQRTGGPDDGVTDHATMQVTCYGATRAQAWQLYRDAQQAVLAAGGTAVTGHYVTNVLVDHTETIASGRQLPYNNPGFQVVVSEFRVDLRRPF